MTDSLAGLAGAAMNAIGDQAAHIAGLLEAVPIVGDELGSNIQSALSADLAFDSELSSVDAFLDGRGLQVTDAISASDLFDYGIHGTALPTTLLALRISEQSVTLRAPVPSRSLMRLKTKRLSKRTL